MALLMAVNPSGESAVTLSRLSRIGSAIETYHEHFQAYPRSYHYDVKTSIVTGSVTGDYSWVDSSTGNAVEGTLKDVLTTRVLRRRDLKYIDQMFVIEDETVELEDGYFIDGWDNKFLYYSGAEIYESTRPTNERNEYVMALWLRAAGALPPDADPVEMKGMHNPNDYYFFMSAGQDGEFSYEVLNSTATDRYDPNEYEAKTLSPDNLLPTDTVNPNQEDFDDMTLYNLRK